MVDKSFVHNAVKLYVEKKASVLFFTLSLKGKILSANQYATQLTGLNLKKQSFYDVIVDFSGKFDLMTAASEPSKERMITVAVEKGPPQTFNFTFERNKDGILAFGQLDAEEIETIRKEVLFLNYEQSNLLRRLHKTNSKLSQKEKSLEKRTQELNKVNEDLEKTIINLKKALKQVKQLSGLLPICMHCKNIRDDKGYWTQIESYIQEHSEAEFSHSLCQDCAKKYYPDMDIYEE